jgi:DNA-binding beta-propeller fold protein YncE/ubiquitin C-terminal hydrolase
MATAADDVKYTLFGKQGTGDNEFNFPLGMAFNHDKTEIFVADSNNNRVQVLSYDREKGELKFKETFINHSRHNLNHPSGVAVFYIKKEKKEKDIIIVADSDNDHICLLNTSIERTYPVFRPCSVSLDACANIFAYDSSNCHIAIFTDKRSSSTKYICEKGKGKGEGQLGGRGTLAFDKDGNLVVADEENNRVQVLNSSDGTYIRTITGIINGGRGGQLNAPCGIAFTDDGKHIIIADFGNNRVRVLTYADGKIINTFGGAKGGEFNGPYGVLVDDENGRIIVSEQNNNRIQVIDNALPKKLSKVEDKSTNTKLVSLQESIINEINSFIEHLKPHKNNNEYIKILNELMVAINKDRVVRAETDADALAKFKLSKKPRTKKAEPKPVSQQMNIDAVKKIITEHEKDAIFVVTGGSFNPPHNGHIGMFQKAYEALIKNSKITMDDGKKVYGVMAPATDDWIENKLCKEVTPATKRRAAGVSSDCTDAERAASLSKAAIELKRIQLANRVNLCKLSCDSYAWPESDKFNASNMIVVNETAEGEKFTSQPNTYYLCGSDYYKDSDTKFICVLRKDDTRERDNLVRIGKDGKTERVPIKDTDIIIENDGEDNDASSTMLRNILTEISKVKIEDGLDVPTLPTKEKLLSLISIPVLIRLLDLKYILTEKNKKTLELMNIDLNAPDAKSSNDTDSKLQGVSGVITNGSRSLCNIGSMCYMNAALQLFYSMPDFRTAIKTPTNPLTEYLTAMDKGVDCEQAGRLARALYDLAQGTSGKAFTDRSFNNQEDASELITRVLSDTMFNACKESIEFVSSIANIYTGENEIDKTCKSTISDESKKIVLGDHDRLISLSPQETGDTLLLPVTDGATTLTTFKEVFDTYLKAYTDIEARTDDSSNTKPLTDPTGIIYSLPDSMMTITKLEGITVSKALKETCKPLIKVESTTTSKDKYKLTHIKNKTYISPGPTQKYFIVILKRTISASKGTQTKLKHSVNLENASINIGGRNFTIKGCVCHHGGSPNSGHYTYVEFKEGKPITVYDDRNIVEYTTYLNTVDRTRTVDTEGYVLLFERNDVK